MKIKEKYQKYKEMKKDPRKKAILQLGIWMAVFLWGYIILVVLMPHPKPVAVSSKKDSYQNRESYQYEITLSYPTEETLEGTYFRGKNYLTYQGVEYYANENGQYLVNSTTKTLLPNENAVVALVFQELSVKNLSEWMEKSEVEESISYQDGTENTKYLYTDEKGFLIPISVRKEKDEIVQIHLDLQAYLASKGEAYPSFEVDLIYKEINNLTNYSKSYENYEVGNLDVTI